MKVLWNVQIWHPLLQIPVVLRTIYSWPTFLELNAKKRGCTVWQLYVGRRTLTNLICKYYFTKREGKLELARDLFASICTDSLMETKEDAAMRPLRTGRHARLASSSKNFTVSHCCKVKGWILTTQLTVVQSLDGFYLKKGGKRQFCHPVISNRLAIILVLVLHEKRRQHSQVGCCTWTPLYLTKE